MRFEIISDITEVETIAINRGIREVTRLRKQYGRARWRKRKGIAIVLLPDGTTRTAELHWYEATSIGQKEYKIKRFLD
jgi:O-acetyl-ADP-ribose deacetylase (regulator of RNase III)